MKTRLLIVCAALLAVLSAAGSHAQEGPYVYKTSVRINTHKYLRYWPSASAKEPTYNTNCWAPRFEFNVQGPLEGGSQLSVTFTKPDGTNWYSQNLPTPEVTADNFEHFLVDGNEQEKKAITQTGTCTMSIHLSNALNKTSKTLFTGKFEVGKFYYGPTAASSPKNACDFYVNHDWELPIGQLAFDDPTNADAPHLHIKLWFRGESQEEQMAGYLYYKGKQIASTKAGGSAKEGVVIETGTTNPDVHWGRWTFSFDHVAEALKHDNGNNNYDGMHFLDKNPGDYELKILRDGKLARTAKFTIGEDGKIVTGGLAEKNKLGVGVIVFPVNVEPGMDRRASIANYKTQAYYGNPLIGFP